jgi:cell division protein FtsB
MQEFGGSMKIFDVVKLNKKVNTLENQVETLENSIKDELYKEFMKKLGETTENDRLKKENKKLRAKIKDLKEIIKGED